MDAGKTPLRWSAHCLLLAITTNASLCSDDETRWQPSSTSCTPPRLLRCCSSYGLRPDSSSTTTSKLDLARTAGQSKDSTPHEQPIIELHSPRLICSRVEYRCDLTMNSPAPPHVRRTTTLASTMPDPTANNAENLFRTETERHGDGKSGIHRWIY